MTTMREEHDVDPIDEILESDPELIRLHCVLVEQQEALKKAVSRKTFQIYLDIEVTTGAIRDVLAERCWAAAKKARR
jgi:hypothetical protein